MAATNVNLDALSAQFINACYADAAECRQLGYDPHEFLRMLSEHGPRETARRLVPDGSLNHLPYGFTRLWELGRLDLTLEAFIHDNPQFHPLFDPDTVANCDVRLAAVQYI